MVPGTPAEEQRAGGDGAGLGLSWCTRTRRQRADPTSYRMSAVLQGKGWEEKTGFEKRDFRSQKMGINRPLELPIGPFMCYGDRELKGRRTDT